MSRYSNLVFRTIPHSIVEWLDCELEKRGIDPSYSHWILSVLQDNGNLSDHEEFFDMKNSKQVGHEYIPPESVFSVKSKYQKRKENIKQIHCTGFSRSLVVASDPIYKNRNDAINCLKSVSDDNSIEDLVDEVCVKLKNLAVENESEEKDLEKSISMIKEETPFYIQPSSPTEQVEKYFAAFPPLERRKEEKVDSIQVAQCNASYNNGERKNKNFVQDILRRSDLNSIKSSPNLDTEPKTMLKLKENVFCQKNVPSKVLKLSKRSHPYKYVKNKKIPLKKAKISVVKAKRFSARRIKKFSSLKKNQNIVENNAIKVCSNIYFGNHKDSCVELEYSEKVTFCIPIDKSLQKLAIKGSSILFAVTHFYEKESRKLFAKFERCSHHKNIPLEFLCIIEASFASFDINSKSNDLFCQSCKLELLPPEEDYIKIPDHIRSGEYDNRWESISLPFPSQKTFYKNLTFPLTDVALVILGNIGCYNFSQEGFLHFFSNSERLETDTIIIDNVNLAKNILQKFCVEMNFDKDFFSESMLNSMFFDKENFPLCNEKMKWIQFRYDSIYHSNYLPKIIASVTEKEVGREIKFGLSDTRKFNEPQNISMENDSDEMLAKGFEILIDKYNSISRDKTDNSKNICPRENYNNVQLTLTHTNDNEEDKNISNMLISKQNSSKNNIKIYSDSEYMFRNSSEEHPLEVNDYFPVHSTSDENSLTYQLENETLNLKYIWENSSEVGESKEKFQITNNSSCCPEMNSEIIKEQEELLNDIFFTTTSKNNTNLYLSDQPISSDEKCNIANTYLKTQELNESTNQPYTSYPNFVAMQTEAKILDNSLISQNDSHLYPVNPIYEGAMHTYAYEESPLYDESAVHSSYENFLGNQSDVMENQVNWKLWSEEEDVVHNQELTLGVDSYIDPCQVYMEPNVADMEGESSWFSSNEFLQADNFLSSENNENESRSTTRLSRLAQLKAYTFKKPCSDFLEGKCSRPDCDLSHEVANITCRFWVRGSCFKGITCPFLHAYKKNPLKFSQNLKKKCPPIQMKKPEPDKKFSLDSEVDFPSLPGSK